MSQSSLRSTLETLLDMVEPRSELEVLLELYVEGSSEWILEDPHIRRWLNFDGRSPMFLHLTGHPGSGKSVMASFVVRHLEDLGKNVQFFFFRFDSQQTGKSIRHCLLSLAYQLALSYPAYGRRLRAMLEDRRPLSNTDVRRLWQKIFVGIFSKLKEMEPIYWIIDAVDESDSVQSLLNLMPSLHSGSCPLRILFLTRPHTVGRAFDKLRLSLPPDAFASTTMATPRDGLSLYIAQELQFTKWPGDPEFLEFITQSLLEKCRGNFLWLRLVLKELSDCDYTHEALLALEETPPELASVYRRVQSQLVKEMRSESRELAVRILSWITCSERPLALHELAEGLKTRGHTDLMLHPQQTIDRLCGDLVVVDKNQMVSMVHHTAKEFLVQTLDISLHVDITQAHTTILLRCLDQLTDPKFRLRVKTEGCQGFLQYACRSWSYHLAFSDEQHASVIQNLGLLLKTNAILSWIDAACQLGQLRILTTAAKNMNAFREKRRKFSIGSPVRLDCEYDLDVMEQWSTDLVRIVGKFGHQLIHHPTAIHTLVPALCPPASIISSQFSATSEQTLMVSELRHRGWDDSVASFSVGHDCQPTVVVALEDHFAVHSHNDTISLYSASVFQKLHTYCHEEVIVALAFSQDGDKMVTCGSRTVKTWDTPTAQLLEVYNNPPSTRAVAATLSTDSRTIIMCCTDGMIRSQQLGCREDWQVTRREVPSDGSLGSVSGTPCAIAFSPDATKLALAFRGKSLGLWSVETGRLVGRCQRRSDSNLMGSPSGMRVYPQRLTWNPIHEHVVGLYNDGTLFKWDPVDMYSEQLESSVEALELACSPDGRFVVTASGDGSLQVWQYDSLRLIYQLSCASPLTSMAVSSDARRIYDLRESFCNVWEPNSLIRLAESEEKTSETSSQHAESIQVSLTSEFKTAISEPVTALAVATGSSTYCFATDDGDLTLNVAGEEAITEAIGYIGATHLVYSPDESRIACADIEGSVTIRRASAGDDDALVTIARINPGSLVQQLLFTPSGSMMLIKGTEKLSLWDSGTGSFIAGRSFGQGDYRVALHPRDQECLIAIGADEIRLLSATDLSIVGSWKLQYPSKAVDAPKTAPNLSKRPFSRYHTGHPGTVSVVGKVLTSPDRQHVFVQTISDEAHGRGCSIDFFLLDICSLAVEGGTPFAASTEAQSLPSAVLRKIEIPLGFIEDATPKTKAASRHSLAFIDVDFWVCTWSPSDTKGEMMQRHFFLPNDWINLDCLEMVTVTPDGRFYCPRNGEIAVVTGGFENAWLG